MPSVHRKPRRAKHKTLHGDSPRCVELDYDPVAAFSENHRATYRIMEDHLITPVLTDHYERLLAGLGLTPAST